MELLKILHRVNRGFLLAGLLTVGLVIYLTAQSLRLEKERPRLQELLETYALDAETLMVLPKDAQKQGQPPPPEVVEAKLQECREVLGKTLSRRPVTGLSAYDEVSETFETMHRENAQSGAYVVGCRTTPGQMAHLRTAGPNLATARFLVDYRAEMLPGRDGQGDCIYFFDMERDRNFSGNIRLDDVLFRQEDGVWKICGTGVRNFYLSP